MHRFFIIAIATVLEQLIMEQ